MDASKIKDFFIFHGEKIVVAVVVAASLWMIYGGLQMPDMRDEQQPDQLAAEANQVRTSIDDDHTEAIIGPRKETLEFDIVAETEKRQTPVDPKPYELPHLLIPTEIDSSTRRQDPQLLAPLELLTSGHIETIAVLNGSNRLTSLEGADAVEVTEQPVAPTRRTRRGGRRGGMDEMESEMEMEMEMQMQMEMEMQMGGMGMGMGGMGMDPTMAQGAQRHLNEKYNFGFHPGASTNSSTNTKPIGIQSAWFIAGTALLPHKQIADAFRTALFDADGYVPQRDQPLYFNYEIQRAEVTRKSVDQLAEDDWVLIGNRESDLKRAAYTWAGYAPELVPQDFRDINLTGYIPPVLLSDYSKFALHPKIPMMSRDAKVQQELMESSAEVKEVNPDDLELAIPGSIGFGGEDNFGMGMGMGMEMGMNMGMSESMNMVEVDPVDFKIMRFYDFARGGDPKSPLPGRKYVYRLRFAVQDPNFPANPLHQPKSSTLAREVYTRIQTLMTKAEETKKREFLQWSPWSEPSQPVSLPALNRYYTGPVEQPRKRTFQVAGREVKYSKSQPTAKALSLNHNVQYATVMPIYKKEVTEGSTMAHSGDVELIDPITLSIKKAPDTKVLSGTTVVDIQGGRSLDMDDSDKLKSPGMMLLFDESGGLKLKSEVGDQESYRIYSFADERGE
ncbi:hypothetical protein [Neorhodopirellula lusitana]|uniref:hypothetical protein n=1 Tax=Neorhodopirellula lusitana TaxID=445327 RepID=UPI00384B5BA1